jgi:amylosucrase
METPEWITFHANRTLTRLLPSIKARIKPRTPDHKIAWNVFEKRLEQNFSLLFGLLHHLYGQKYDFFYYVEDLLFRMADAWLKRPNDLKQIDEKREKKPVWFLSQSMVGGVCYVDLYAGNLQGLRDKLPYLKELGLTYLHLMPLFKSPRGENDGGYAVSSYREVNPDLGTMDELQQLAAEFRQEGISLVLDFVFNHTSDEHEWAKLARQGDPEYIDFYHLFNDETMPNAYQMTLRDIFPEERSGAFTYDPEWRKWIWTTFHSYQWDLNYSNPAVFNQMASEILFLANSGVEILRLDAVAFIWKKMGTSCENLPEAHLLIQAFNKVCRIAAPSLLFKSEAIVHPDDVVKYVSLEECQLSYNPLLMAMLWNTLATRDVSLLKVGLAERFNLPAGCTWVNYVRCHDDIGWTFADEDAIKLGINPFEHRKFLNSFYTGRFPGSFARGLPFQENPRTGDMRISGMCASLAGLEKALNEETEFEVDLAIRRIVLVHAISITIGGIPLIYLGDEVGILNDYSFRKDQTKSRDSRWVHRPKLDWEQIRRRQISKSTESEIFKRLTKIIHLRKTNTVFSNGNMQVMDTGTAKVLGYVREYNNQRCIVMANFSEEKQIIPANILRLYGSAYRFKNLLSDQQIEFVDLELDPFEIKFLLA